MARDFDYNDFDAPELVKPTPVQDDLGRRDSNRDDQVRVRRRQSSRSRSLDDQFETFDTQGPAYNSDLGAANPSPNRNNAQRTNFNGRANNNVGNYDNFENFNSPNSYSANSNGGNNYNSSRNSYSNGRDGYDNGRDGYSNSYDGYNNGRDGYNTHGNGYNMSDGNYRDNYNAVGDQYPSGNNSYSNRAAAMDGTATNTRSANNYPSNDYPSYNNPSNNNPSNNNPSSQGSSNPTGSTSRQGNRNNTPRQQNRRQNNQRPQQPQERQSRIRQRLTKGSLVRFFSDPRTHKFFGVVLIVAAALITIFTFSHLKNASADQAVSATHTVAQIAQQPDLVENAGGPVGAKTGHLMITRTLGMGSLVVIVYLVFLGLGLLGLKKIQFWSLTFKCLLISITTSVVLGFILGKASTGIYWGGTHGLAVNGWLHDHMGWIGQAAASFVLIAAVVIVYFEELARFIKRQKEIYQARRQRLAFEQDQELRRQEAVDESLTSIGEEEYEDDYIDPDDPNYQSQSGSPQYGTDSQGSYQTSDSSQTAYQPQGTYQSQGTYQPQGTYQSQGRYEGQNSTNGPSIRDGYNLDTDIEALGQNQRNAQNQTMVPTSQADPSNTTNPHNGNSQSRFTAADGDVPFAIDEQNIETVPVSINVGGAESQQQNVPMEVSVNEIETVDVDDVQPDYDPTAELSHYHKPSLDLLVEHSSSTISVDAEEMEANKKMIITTLRNYGIEISSIEATVGPTVTLFEVVPADGVRISAIKRLEDDIARSLSAIGIRIITPMPGKNTVGLEVPNRVPQIVSMRSILTSRAYQETKARLPMAMGTTITNEVFIEDLTKMPHLLVAGATGQGKSVGLNAIITSLIYKKHPSELKFVMVDPKMVEFSLYSKIERHFLAKLPDEEDPIITDCDKVKQTLNSLCVEMDDRYALLKDAFVRSLEEYNAKFVKHRLNPEKGHRYLPYIVVVVDEFADLIMMAGKDIEQPIARIAQKARAVGIHLIIATQRPSTNVITGIIKANFPGRIAFKVSQMVDSRTILDRTGANQLIGKGDMLVMRDSKLERVQCAFVSTEEVEAICEDIASQVGYDHAYYLPEPTEAQGGGNGGSGEFGGPAFGDRDSMFEECARFIVMQDTASTSMLQRRFSIGYNKAGRIMDQLEAAGIVSAANGQKPRMVLVDPDQLENILLNI